MAEWVSERLPEDIEAERALLATCCAPGMGQEAADVAYRLKREDFVHPAHAALFSALRRLIEDRLDINAITLKDALHRADELSRVGDFAGLVEILSGDEVRNPHVLADILIQKRMLRELIKIGAKLVRNAAGEENTAEALVEQVGLELSRLAQGQDKRGLEHISDVMHDSYESLLNRLEGRGSSGQVVGFSELDNLTHGFQPGNLIVLAARPRVGKTALALNWLLRASWKHGAHVALFSLEMSKREVTDRLISAHSQVDLRTVARGDIDRAIYDKLKAVGEELNRLPIYVCDSASVTTRDIAAMVERHLTRTDKKLDMVIIDYLQLITSPQDSRGSKLNEAVRVAEISRALKILAKEHHVPVVVLSQLNREVERRIDGKPQLSDLRDSGAIEQDADIVMFIHREKDNKSDKSSNNLLPEGVLIVAKHRNGPTRTIPMHFIGEHSLFVEVDPTTQNPH